MAAILQKKRRMHLYDHNILFLVQLLGNCHIKMTLRPHLDNSLSEIWGTICYWWMKYVTFAMDWTPLYSVHMSNELFPVAPFIDMDEL